MITTPTLLDGKSLAQERLRILKEQIYNLCANNIRAPQLVVIQLGDDSASNLYIRRKQTTCEQAGIKTRHLHLPNNCSESTVIAHIKELNEDNNVDGILVQLPLPEHIHKEIIIENIAVRKDVDGFHPYHLGKLAQGQPSIRPCTPLGIMHLLEEYQCPIMGINALVLGRSTIVGRPMSLELCNAGATVTIAHSQTQNLQCLVQQAEILVCATGIVDVINSNWIKKGAIVIDVGIHYDTNGKIRGDLDSNIVSQHAAFYTPVPGGVGPMTVVSLLQNTWTLYQQHLNLTLTHEKERATLS